MSNDDDLKNINKSEQIILTTENTSSTLNDILGKENSEHNSLPTISRKIPENQPLSLNIMKKNNFSEQSTVIQVPQSIGSDNYNIDLNSSNDKGTLDESVQTTINRDLKLIYNKLKLVINPLIPKEKKYNQIKQWDLWGPLLLNLILAFTLTLNTKAIIYLNNQFLGVNASIFQMFCLLGYCLFPLNIAALIITLINFNDMIRLILVGCACFMAIYSSSDYLKIITNNEQRYLVLYPCILFYLYISWLVFATKA